MRGFNLMVVWSGVLFCAGLSYGAVMTEVGPDSVLGHPTTAQPGWPSGLVELPRHESRVFSVWGPGWDIYLFKANHAQIQALIHHFSKTRMRDHELIIKERKQQAGSYVGREVDHNAKLDIHDEGWLTAGKEVETPGTYEPTLTIYVDLPADRALADRIVLPDNIILNNEVADFPLKGKAIRPKRELWYAQVRFDDSTPAVDFEHHVITKVTLWDKNVQEGIKIGRVDYKGNFHAAFSEKEIADLKAGNSWITLTVGNWSTEAKRDDPVLSWLNLLREKEMTLPVMVAKPKFYYGRIVFEDGSPETSSLRSVKDILVDLPFTGGIRPDSDGYFRVFFTDEQFEKAKAGKERKNIYVPSREKPNTSTAMFVFPVSKLSREKEKAGVVRIPIPRGHSATAP